MGEETAKQANQSLAVRTDGVSSPESPGKGLDASQREESVPREHRGAVATLAVSPPHHLAAPQRKDVPGTSRATGSRAESKSRDLQLSAFLLTTSYSDTATARTSAPRRFAPSTAAPRRRAAGEGPDAPGF